MPLIQETRCPRRTVTKRSPLVSGVDRFTKWHGSHVSTDVGTTLYMAPEMKRREKSRSYGDLLRPITPVTKLEFELERREYIIFLDGSSPCSYTNAIRTVAQPTPTPRLSTVVDKNLFISSPISPIQRVEEDIVMTPQTQKQKDALTESPLVVEPYPAKPVANASVTIDTPAKRHIEGVYDR